MLTGVRSTPSLLWHQCKVLEMWRIIRVFGFDELCCSTSEVLFSFGPAALGDIFVEWGCPVKCAVAGPLRLQSSLIVCSWKLIRAAGARRNLLGRGRRQLLPRWCRRVGGAAAAVKRVTLANGSASSYLSCLLYHSPSSPPPTLEFVSVLSDVVSACPSQPLDVPISHRPQRYDAADVSSTSVNYSRKQSFECISH